MSTDRPARGGWVGDGGFGRRLAVALCLAAFGSGAAADLKDMKVLYLGEPGSRRAVEFQTCLRTNVARIQTASRREFDPDTAMAFDVVLLDWQQNSSGEIFPPKRSPFGPRRTWIKPTVLLGSAGLHMAVVWEVKGGSG